MNAEGWTREQMTKISERNSNCNCLWYHVQAVTSVERRAGSSSVPQRHWFIYRLFCLLPTEQCRGIWPRKVQSLLVKPSTSSREPRGARDTVISSRMGSRAHSHSRRATHFRDTHCCQPGLCVVRAGKRWGIVPTENSSWGVRAASLVTTLLCPAGWQVFWERLIFPELSLFLQA